MMAMEPLTQRIGHSPGLDSIHHERRHSINPHRHGSFPLTEAARLAQLDTQTARRWALGYTYSYGGEKRDSPGVMPLTLPALQGERVDIS